MILTIKNIYIIFIGILFALQLSAQNSLNIQGSSTVNSIIVEAAEIFSSEKGMEILVDTQGGSSGGIAAVAEGLADIGMSSKSIDRTDKVKFPRAIFNSFTIGIDGVALVVSKPVWDGGVRALTRKQVQAIYEGRIRTWKQLHGPPSRIVFYNKEPGRGTWSMFANWVYGSHKQAPPVSHLEVGSNEETQNKVSQHASAISQLSFAWAKKSKKLGTVGIKTNTGETVYPTVDTIQSGQYPLSRKLFLITNGKPNKDIKDFIDFVLGSAGQKLVRKHGYIPVNR